MTSVFLNSLMTLGLGIGLLSLSEVSFQAKASTTTKFSCTTEKGIPITVAQATRGHVPVIHWISEYFSKDGWTPQTRCIEVSTRFERYYNDGSLKFLTTGRMKKLPVICTTKYRGGGCENLLFTLKPGTDSSETLKNLLQIKNRVRGPLNETDGRIYIDVRQLIEGN